MGILSHAKRWESSRRRHSDDGELDLSGPLLIYRHGHDMSVCACVEGIFFDRNEVHGLICGRCWILALIKRWMLFVWAQLIGRECIPQKIRSRIDMPLLLCNGLNIAHGKTGRLKVTNVLSSLCYWMSGTPLSHAYTQTLSQTDTPPAHPWSEPRLLQDVGGCQCWWIPTFDCEAAHAPGEKSHIGHTHTNTPPFRYTTSCLSKTHTHITFCGTKLRHIFCAMLCENPDHVSPGNISKCVFKYQTPFSTIHIPCMDAYDMFFFSLTCVLSLVLSCPVAVL